MYWHRANWADDLCKTAGKSHKTERNHATENSKAEYVLVDCLQFDGRTHSDEQRGGPCWLLALTTTGRKSGQPREVSLVYIKSGSAYVIAGSNAGRDKHPGWYFNLRSNQEVTVQIKKQQFKAIAEIAGSEQRKHLWKQLVEASPMFARYEKSTQREIPMVLLHPED